MRASVLLLAAASVAVASAETVEIFGAGEEGGSEFRVYPIATAGTATTYLLGCPDQGATEENCIFLEPIVYTVKPDSVEFTSSQPDLTFTQNCALGAKTRAVCTIKVSGPGTTDFESVSDKTEETMTLTGTAAEKIWGPATIVDDVTSIYRGAEASIGPAPSSTGGSIPPVTTGPGASSAPTDTPTGTDSKPVETSQSTGGMPQITGSSGWAVGGVAAAVALAAF
ncbi:hypothetical protein V494_06408 [Pseudogymnoascus sp. VKM F-4513 (FW-928)]|nr:hypothetical protein V494_06408 [Pseudogymnoascus sp. VKM F-4513 (FW-928)]